MIQRGFENSALIPAELDELKDRARLCRGDIVKMTTLAGSGHPGGSMSSIDIMVLIWAKADLDPANPCKPARDYVVVSHGHVSPAVYSALGRTGYFDVDQAVAGFRMAGSVFEGHVEHRVPGVEWNTGNLGQGLSAGCGLALAQRLHGRKGRTFVVMSDGEQAKGQIAEARRFAVKFGLDLTVIIDYNELQISGSIHEVMPNRIAAGYEADGWAVLNADGHDFQSLYSAVRTALDDGRPTMVLAKTVMGKGVSFMENKVEYHGAALNKDQCASALAELAVENDLTRLEAARKGFKRPGIAGGTCPIESAFSVDPGKPKQYSPEQQTDNRSAFGTALLEVAQASARKPGSSPIAVFDCDLAVSVKTAKFASEFPQRFFQAGVQEHNAATIAGALSSKGVVCFFADFGVFGIDETYNQHRLNDINWANLKVACTHVGIDVGEDGKTHHCLDYVGAMRNIFGYNVVVPADPNQTDRVVRAVAGQPGCWLIAMGRSKTPLILAENGSPVFGGGYEFVYGRADWVRAGFDCVIATMGQMTARAVEASARLARSGVKAGVLNVSCPKKLDADALRKAAETGLIVSYEDHNVHTGLGSCIADFILENSLPTALVKMGVGSYAPSGRTEDILAVMGLTPQHLEAKILHELKKT